MCVLIYLLYYFFWRGVMLREMNHETQFIKEMLWIETNKGRQRSRPPSGIRPCNNAHHKPLKAAASCRKLPEFSFLRIIGRAGGRGGLCPLCSLPGERRAERELAKGAARATSAHGPPRKDPCPEAAAVEGKGPSPTADADPPRKPAWAERWSCSPRMLEWKRDK